MDPVFDSVMKKQGIIKKLVFAQKPVRRRQEIPKRIKDPDCKVFKRIIIVIYFLASLFDGSAQNKYADSVRKLLENPKDDTSKVLNLADLSYFLRYTNTDSAMYYARTAYSLAQQIKFARGEAYALSYMAQIFREKGELPKSLRLQLDALKIAEKYSYLPEAGRSFRRIALIYFDLTKFRETIDWCRKALHNHLGDLKEEEPDYFITSMAYIEMKNVDTSWYFLHKASEKLDLIQDLEPEFQLWRGNAFWLRRNKDSALAAWKEGLDSGLNMKYYRTASYIFYYMGEMYRDIRKPDSSIYCAKQGLKYARMASHEKTVLWSSRLLFKIYDSLNNPAEALLYLKIAVAAKDSLLGAGNIQAIEELIASENARQTEIQTERAVRQQQIQAERASYQNRLRLIMLAAGMGVLLIIAFLLYRNNRQKKTAFLRLQKQERQTNLEKSKAERALQELRAVNKEIESKNRDLEVEGSLEKVRGRANAMLKSVELQEVLQLIFDQLLALHFRIDSATFIDDHEENFWSGWIAVKGNIYASEFQLSLLDHPSYNFLIQAKKRGLDFYSQALTIDESKVFFSHFFQHVKGVTVPEERRKIMLETTGLCRSAVLGKNIVLVAQNYNGIPFSDKEDAILKRFGKTFDQIYTRYLDLQNAEAQARESRIEYSLEKLRSKTMAMHNSQDVADATATMFQELESLGVETLRCGIVIGKENFQMEVWTAKYNPEGKIELTTGMLDMTFHPSLLETYKAWQQKKSNFSYHFEGKDLNDYYEAISKMPQYPMNFQLASLPEKQSLNSFYFPEGRIYVFTADPLSDQASDILERFAGVFALTYRRFQDLQKAEFQAKEAIIEAAIEKVRGKAMAMHSSQDLSTTAAMVFTEVRKLGISPFRCGVGIIDLETRKMQLYTSVTSGAEDSFELSGWAIMSGEPQFEKAYEHWINKEDFFPVLAGEEIKSFYDHLSVGISIPYIPDWKSGKKQYGYILPIEIGIMHTWTEYELTKSDVNILKRFAAVIDLTFRRYFELQQSESNAKEAVRQASLDRVRAEIASMRTTNDLNKIIPLIWVELKKLGIRFTRCGVYIMDEMKELTHAFLSTPEGNAIASVDVPFDKSGILRKIIDQWRLRRPYLHHWNSKDINAFVDILIDRGAIKSREQYLSLIPREGIFLHCMPFLQGMLYVGNTTRLEEDEINLIQSLADAFSTAYSRYEDFNKLESAKIQVEKSLTDLKSTQSLLIQSEKMASLGEMTAGIAHEIQNPLNFVNNFSEVNSELVSELKDQIQKENYPEVKRLAAEIENNEQKIIHHGKRADSIVKNMLLHTRSSTGQKESTDINALAGEWLRLAFHGLRAKDKTFNATMTTDFDKSIGKINIIPQDMGRVLLNLYNNAFYTVAEKRRQTNDYYEPIISVCTKQSNEHVEILVRDNGTGIPKKVQDKIFQPFFTTKPAGEGTGLGLSMAYDIIKAHGGEIKVRTNENEGSEFLIQLPIH
jgi:signal transduction histidine kinase